MKLHLDRWQEFENSKKEGNSKALRNDAGIVVGFTAATSGGMKVNYMVEYGRSWIGGTNKLAGDFCFLLLPFDFLHSPSSFAP